uniref:LRRC8 pannexin-like TM region domain-containing protein n=1 Tax=Castor canadensis TaxID=51338 RepID=A0A8C0VX97_CASCN
MFTLAEVASLNDIQPTYRILKPWWDVFMDYLAVVMLMVAIFGRRLVYKSSLLENQRTIVNSLLYTHLPVLSAFINTITSILCTYLAPTRYKELGGFSDGGSHRPWLHAAR